MTDLGAAWMLYGWTVFSLIAVLTYIADIAPTLGCHIVLMSPGLYYFWSCYRRASVWLFAVPLSDERYVALLCGMFGAVMVPLWGGFAFQSLVLVRNHS
jgi:hypothetical protein